jgi:peroxiredoxin
MNMSTRLIPNQPVPPLRVKTVGGPCWRLCDQKPQHFTLVLFYRGLHCGFCKTQLQAYEARYEEFRKLGVRVLAVSSDDRERAERTVRDWHLDELTVCWGLTIDQARDWGLYLSEGHGKGFDGVEEPNWFVEPGLFFIKPDGRLYAGFVQTVPVAQPRIDDVLAGIRFAIETATEPPGGADEQACRGDDCGCHEPVKLHAVGEC